MAHASTIPFEMPLISTLMLPSVIGSSFLHEEKEKSNVQRNEIDKTNREAFFFE
jgi:hypothetical protein